MTVQLSGFFSGMDTQSIIDQLDQINRLPAEELELDQQLLDAESDALSTLDSAMESLASKFKVLSDPETFAAKSVSGTNASVGTATVTNEAQTGSVKVEITQIATSSNIKSGSTVSSQPAGTALAESVFGSSVLGSFTVNGTQITIDSSTTLNDIVTAIEATTDNDAATTQYDASTGLFTIANTTDSVILGSPTDTSDFLQQAQLFNNGSNSVTSAQGVGRLNTSSALNTLSFDTGSVSADGSITINGVAVSYSATDSLETVLANITASDAGVVATYDSYSDQVVLTSKDRGSLGLTVADGPLAQALKIRTGTDTTATLGNSTTYKINGGAERVSTDSNLSGEELGIEGLSFTPSDLGTTTLTVGADIDTIQSAIDEFITQYNNTQELITEYTKTNNDDPDLNAILANDSSLTYLPNSLRTALTTTTSGSGTIQMLEDLGITSSSEDDTLTVSDSGKLKEALENNLDDVITLFTDTTAGIAARLDPLIESFTDDVSGTFKTRQDSITSQKDRIDREIELIEIRADAERAYLVEAFAAMETAQAEASYYSSFFTDDSSSS